MYPTMYHVQQDFVWIITGLDGFSTSFENKPPTADNPRSTSGFTSRTWLGKINQDEDSNEKTIIF